MSRLKRGDAMRWLTATVFLILCMASPVSSLAQAPDTEKFLLDGRLSEGSAALAVIKVDGKVVGEVYSSPLEGTPEEEAKGMAASPKKSEQIELKKQGTEKLGNEEAEYVTLKMNLKGTFGEPWIIHSVYIPRAKSCVTFKLVSSEEQFSTLLPYLTAMLAPDLDKKKKE